MKRRNRRLRQGGFTLIELLIVMVLLLVLALIGFPALDEMLVRVKTRSYTTDVATLMQRARIEAVKLGETVVRVDTDTGEVVGFVDENGDAVLDPTERVLGRPTLPRFITFSAPTTQTVVDGFDSAANVAWLTFNRDGSVDKTGALRIGDARGNFFEWRVTPRASGRVQVRKWDEARALNRDGTHWYASGEGGPWTWE